MEERTGGTKVKVKAAVGGNPSRVSVSGVMLGLGLAPAPVTMT